MRLARRLRDPALLTFVLNGAFMQSFATCSSAARAGTAAARQDMVPSAGDLLSGRPGNALG
ncbi:hypothetical protein [Streptomyces sp. NPDC058847]|uniref:hypothetical protein n=1 Tax=Streptomyces sp. NPDC058847 TaxID=3346649 RepID=UPI0036C86A05